MALLMVAHSGCVAEAPAGDGQTACGARELQSLVGQQESVLATMKFDQTIRIIRPDTAVTMDFRADRLNIRIDTQGLIGSVYCG